MTGLFTVPRRLGCPSGRGVAPVVGDRVDVQDFRELPFWLAQGWGWRTILVALLRCGLSLQVPHSLRCLEGITSGRQEVAITRFTIAIPITAIAVRGLTLVHWFQM